MKAAIYWEAGECYAEPRIWYKEKRDGSLRLYEPNGITSSFREEGHQMRAARKALAKLIDNEAVARGVIKDK